MLDAGNSMASVSQLLAVPATEIERWRTEFVAPPPPPKPSAHQGAGPGRVPTFGKTLVVRRHFPQDWANHVGTLYAVTAVWVALMAFTLHKPAAFGKLLFVLDFTATFALVLWWSQRLRPVIRLTSDAIVVPRPLGRSTLRYADLADWSLAAHVKTMAYQGREFPFFGQLLTLVPRRPGARPIEVFVHDHIRIGREVTERLELVKQVNAGRAPATPTGR